MWRAWREEERFRRRRAARPPGLPPGAGGSLRARHLTGIELHERPEELWRLIVEGADAGGDRGARTVDPDLARARLHAD